MDCEEKKNCAQPLWSVILVLVCGGVTPLNPLWKQKEKNRLLEIGRDQA
jgi:hypothetical protein